MSVRRTLLPFLLICLLTGLYSFSTRPDTLTDDILKYTNEFRRSKGKPALEVRDDLNEIAREHSLDMAKGKRSFGHDGFKKRADKVRKKMGTYNSIAENVAYGPTSGLEVVTGWKNSAGHRTNMLGDYKFIGIGVAENNNGRLYYTQIFVR